MPVFFVIPAKAGILIEIAQDPVSPAPVRDDKFK